MESALYGMYALVVFVSENSPRSLRSLVRFLIRQQLVRKYHKRALSMKLSIYIRKSNLLIDHAKQLHFTICSMSSLSFAGTV